MADALRLSTLQTNDRIRDVIHAYGYSKRQRGFMGGYHQNGWFNRRVCDYLTNGC
jgi:hypothetical protein